MGTPQPRPVPYNEAPRPHSNSHEARSPTRKNSDSHDPGSERSTHSNSPTPRRKLEHLMRLPTTTYRHGHNQDQRGGNAGVSLHYFTTHPMMGGEKRHCTHLTVHYPSLVTLEGGYDKAHIPQSLGFGLIRPVSTWPRPNLDAPHRSTGKEGRHGTALWVTSSSHPLRHHGVQGWPPTPRAHRYSPLNRVRQKITLRLAGILASSYPIKGPAKTLPRDNEQ
jgi:hypothetical protein